MKKYFVTSKLSENMAETPEGFLLCLAVPIARTGTMLYAEGETPLEAGKDGTIEVERSEAEVFRAQTIASFEGKPVTISHPQDFVTADNWSYLAKGIVQNVRRGTGDFADSLLADLLITDKIAIGLVKSGLREVSCGYEAEYTQAGEGKGVQTGIIGNHVALVDEGRAGSEYAIKDHKGVKMDKKNVFEKMMSVLGITKDEAKKLVQDADMPDDKKVDKKDDKAKDAETPVAGGYDELVKAVKDLQASVSSMSQPTVSDAEKADKDEGKKDDKAADADEDTSIEGRLSKLEAAISKLLEGKTGDADEEGGMIEDEDMGEESEDEDMDEEESEDVKPTGDTASRVEILAPGLQAKGKDVKAKALKACYATKEGKSIIDSLSGGKAPAFDSAEKVDMLFTATSELLKVQRNKNLSKTKQVRDAELIDGTPDDGVMTADKMNELNAKFYKRS